MRLKIYIQPAIKRISWRVALDPFKSLSRIPEARDLDYFLYPWGKALLYLFISTGNVSKKFFILFIAEYLSKEVGISELRIMHNNYIILMYYLLYANFINCDSWVYWWQRKSWNHNLLWIKCANSRVISSINITPIDGPTTDPCRIPICILHLTLTCSGSLSLKQFALNPVLDLPVDQTVPSVTALIFKMSGIIFKQISKTMVFHSLYWKNSSGQFLSFYSSKVMSRSSTPTS